jgi:prolyl-tRNA editing enzyme YbaK/EbsC (Cys-tRNA(Pro) deacylase)
MPKKKIKKTKLPVRLVKYLERAGVKHEILEHKTVYTAIDAAITMKKKLDEIAKSLLVKAGRDYYIVILSADQNLNFEKLAACLERASGKKIKAVKIPSEKVMSQLLKIKSGGLNAFGNLYKLPVVVEKKMTKKNRAVFPAGSFNHSVEMAVKDFIKLENAILGSFGIKKKVKLVKTVKSSKCGGAKKKTARKKK